MRHLTEDERRAATAVGFGGPGTRELKLLRWRPRPNAARTVLGFVDVETPSGLQIRDIRLGVGPKGKYYIMLPAEQQRDRYGNPVLDDRSKPRWFAHVDFRNDRTRERFQGELLAVLRFRHPEIFVGESKR
jgi:hypothetical protein